MKIKRDLFIQKLFAVLDTFLFWMDLIWLPFAVNFFSPIRTFSLDPKTRELNEMVKVMRCMPILRKLQTNTHRGWTLAAFTSQRSKRYLSNVFVARESCSTTSFHQSWMLIYSTEFWISNVIQMFKKKIYSKRFEDFDDESAHTGSRWYHFLWNSCKLSIKAND